MAKFYDEIGYIKTVETKPGIWGKVVAAKKYSGDIDNYTRRWQNNTKVNDDVNITSRISIVADSYLLENSSCIRYVKLHGAYWEVTSITPQYPRLLLDLGGVYNGEVAGNR